MGVRERAPPGGEGCPDFRTSPPASEAENPVQLFLLIKGGGSGGIYCWMLLEARAGRAGLVHRCTEFLVLPLQRNTEIVLRRKRENSNLGV